MLLLLAVHLAAAVVAPALVRWMGRKAFWVLALAPAVRRRVGAELDVAGAGRRTGRSSTSSGSPCSGSSSRSGWTRCRG